MKPKREKRLRFVVLLLPFVMFLIGATFAVILFGWGFLLTVWLIAFSGLWSQSDTMKEHVRRIIELREIERKEEN